MICIQHICGLIWSYCFLHPQVQESTSTSSTKKKNKFTNLYAKEGQDKLTVVLPGRHSCDCLAQKHSLINNCISCGRIVCEQEGSGPCLFCGSLVQKLLLIFFAPVYDNRKPIFTFKHLSIPFEVCTKEEQEILLRDSNKSQKLRKKLMGGENLWLALPQDVNSIV